MDNTDLQLKFTDYVNELKNQSVDIKRSEIIDSLKELISLIDVICKKEGIDIEYLKSREINDLADQDTSEDDFLEACIVYVENVKNNISKYLIYKDLI